MPVQDLHVRFKTPNWKWCEIANPDGKTKTGERCRFCKEIKNRGDATHYKCLIYDKDLMVEAGSVVKCGACLLFRTNFVEHTPELSKKRTACTAGQIAQKVIKQYSSMYKQMRREGYPADVAVDLTNDLLRQEWK